MSEAKPVAKERKPEGDEGVVSRLTRAKTKDKLSALYLPTGYTPLNLAMSGKVRGGIQVGTCVLFVGDSHSGKTVLAHSCLAEASVRKGFAGHRLIFDDVGGGAMESLQLLFGDALIRRLEPPARNKDRSPKYSETVEDFYYHLDDATKVGKPFVYVLDDMDTLSSQDELRKVQKDKGVWRRRADGKVRVGKDGTEEKEAGSYGDGKAKKNSQYLRQFMGFLRRSGSLLIIITQTRDNIGFGAMFNPKVRSGGHALRFQANQEIWTSIIKPIKRTVLGKERKIGVLSKIHIRKNRQTGGDHTVEVPILRSLGIDDLGGCVDFLISEGRWSKEGDPRDNDKGKIAAEEFDFSGTKEALIKFVEDKGREKELRELVGSVWAEIEEGCKVARKPRYG